MNPWIEVDGGVGPKNAYKVCLFRNIWSVLLCGGDPKVVLADGRVLSISQELKGEKQSMIYSVHYSA